MRTSVRFGGALLLFLVLATVRTSPLLSHFGSHVPADARDPLLITWILAWDVHALSTAPARLFDANIFFPVERSLAFSDHLLGVLPLFAPAYLLTGNPVAAYNAVFLLSFALSGFTGFCLAYSWTRAFWPSLVGGALFGFAPYRLGQLAHLQLLSFFWAPLALLFVDRFLVRHRWRDLTAFTACFWLQVLSTVYLGFMLTVAVTAYAAYYALAVDRRILTRSMLARVGAAAASGLVATLPFLLPYLAVNRTWGASRPIGGIVGYSADVLSYLKAPSLMNDLYLVLFNPTAPWPTGERDLFPGLLLIGLVIIGGRATVGGLPPGEVSRLRRASGLVIVLAVVLSLGPFLVAFGHKTRIPLPYLLLYHVVPGWTGMRVPARFAFLAVLAAVPIATFGALACCEAAARRGPAAWRRLAFPVVAIALVVALFLELGAKPMPLVQVIAGRDVPEVYRWLAAARPGPIAELPITLDQEYEYVYLSTRHWLPLVNGHSSFVPPTYFEIRDALNELPGPRAVEYAGALGVAAVVVHTDRLSALEQARWAAAEHRLPLRVLATFGHDVVYSVPPVDARPVRSSSISVPLATPAGREIRIGLMIRADGALPWVHPRPLGESRAQVTWRTDRDRSPIRQSVRAQLPPVIPAGETAAIPLAIKTPVAPGPYTLEVSVPFLTVGPARATVVVRRESPVTSRDAAAGLGARYTLPQPLVPLVVAPSQQITVRLTATNTGQAVWLARATNDRGVVSLAWRWRDATGELEALSGSSRIRFDVFPGQRYEFRAPLDAPGRPGRYTLEFGLVSESVGAFAASGTAPLRLAVEVRP